MCKRKRSTSDAQRSANIPIHPQEEPYMSAKRSLYTCKRDRSTSDTQTSAKIPIYPQKEPYTSAEEKGNSDAWISAKDTRKRDL